jgi:hypothetical protein
MKKTGVIMRNEWQQSAEWTDNAFQTWNFLENGFQIVIEIKGWSLLYVVIGNCLFCTYLLHILSYENRNNTINIYDEIKCFLRYGTKI